MRKQNFVTWRGWFPQSRYAARGLLLREAEARSAAGASVWWTDERPLAVVISPERSKHRHLKLLIVANSWHRVPGSLRWASISLLLMGQPQVVLQVLWAAAFNVWMPSGSVPVQPPPQSVRYQLVLVFIILICKGCQNPWNSPAIAVEA